MNADLQSQFSNQLTDWYWKYGCKRKDDYTLSTSSWTKSLYDVSKQVKVIIDSTGNSRPAMAIWGPSQTGKSTLVSAYIDANAKFEKTPGVDGVGSGLHWQGGTPAFFMAPDVDEDAGERLPGHICVLNPFNGGRDASACLSRFVYGTKSANTDFHYVKNINYPIGIFFAKPIDIWHAIARGYDTECLGPAKSPTRNASQWTLPKFQTELAKFVRANKQHSKKAPDRKAYEALHDFCEILDDLVFAELPRFRQLLDEGEDNWQSIRASLLSEKVLVSDLGLVEKFAALIFWDANSVLTEYYNKMKKAKSLYSKKFGNKPVYCTIPVASLLLDMDSCKMYFEPVPSNAKSDDKERMIHDKVPRLAYTESEDSILIGLDNNLPDKLVQSAEDYALFQGLVWELIIPLNPDNLPQTPFKEFLQESDILDFPGVGNERAGEATQIDLEPDSAISAVTENNDQSVESSEIRKKGIPFEAKLFFLQILKRGKTSSIVSTYAKRCNIDGFCIFQNLDGYPPVNSQQLITGINTWWKYFIPDYYRDQNAPCPLPLNVALLWWALMINQAPNNAATILGSKEANYKTLGIIADPEVSTTFALNYHRFSRGKIHRKFDKETELYKTIRNEEAFLKQFGADVQSVSINSFEAMVDDFNTGGADYFFTRLKEQILTARQNPDSNRINLLNKKLEDTCRKITDLLNTGKLFPPKKQVDIRKINLTDFSQGLEAQVKGNSEKAITEINHVLREYLDINYQALMPIPNDIKGITKNFVDRQLRQWINKQLARYDNWEAGGRKGIINWSKLGIGNREQFRDYLDALRLSIEKTFEETAQWLIKLIRTHKARLDLLNIDLRRHLAVRLSNEIVYSHTSIQNEEFTDHSDDEDLFLPKFKTVTGKDCLSYKLFIKPFVETQLKRFINLRLTPVLRPDDIPGDDEIVGLCKEYELLPDSVKEDA